MVIGPQRFFNSLMDGNDWTGSGLLDRKMAAVVTKTSHLPTSKYSVAPALDRMLDNEKPVVQVQYNLEISR